MKRDQFKNDSGREVELIGADIISSERFRKAEKICHHKRENVADHSLRVAKRGYRMAVWLEKRGVSVDPQDVVRGSLLHDIGMTEDAVFDSVSFKKAYRHPRKGAAIAVEEFHANQVQTDAVRRHMWPICIIPPLHTAGWIVVAADKYCSVREVLHL